MSLQLLTGMILIWLMGWFRYTSNDAALALVVTDLRRCEGATSFENGSLTGEKHMLQSGAELFRSMEIKIR